MSARQQGTGMCVHLVCVPYIYLYSTGLGTSLTRSEDFNNLVTKKATSHCTYERLSVLA